MYKRIYLITRDLHLYLGLFISPFVVVFAISVFVLVHFWIPAPNPAPTSNRTIANLDLPQDVEAMSGRARIDALQAALNRAGVRGEIGFVRYVPRERRLVVPISIPGRETTVSIDLVTRGAAVEQRDTGLLDAFVTLHKLPGPHLADIRMNWIYMALWRWFADATVYLLMFIFVTGVYLWYSLRAERRIGLALIAAGAASFLGVVYALTR